MQLKNFFNNFTNKQKQVKEISQKNNIFENLLNSLGGVFRSVTKEVKAINSTRMLNNYNQQDFLTIDRNTLEELYRSNPVVFKTVDKPVDDALRGGINIECSYLDEEIEELYKAFHNTGAIQAISEAFKWSRLFGGSAIVIGHDCEDLSKPFEISQVKKGDEVEFFAVDRWQINTQVSNIDSFGEVKSGDIWTIAGTAIHSSRFIPIIGINAPSSLRRQLGGWGLSEVEKMLSSLNLYEKYKSVITELAEEAKIDVVKMKGFKDAVGDPVAEEKLKRSLFNIAMLKKETSLIGMDSEDDYISKTVNLAGASQIGKDANTLLSMASDLPQDILMGQGASGFSSGEDVIERYNASVESKVREKMLEPLHIIKQILMLTIWGVVYKSTISFNSLRTLTTTQEENILTNKVNRLVTLVTNNLISLEEAKDYIAKNKILG